MVLAEITQACKLIPAITTSRVISAAFWWLIGLAGVICLVIEFIPIINAHPISKLLQIIGKVVNKEVVQQVNDLRDDVNGIKKENAERYAINCRSNILSFGDEIRQGVKHSKENFDQILQYIDIYDQYCKDHPEFKNNKTHLTTKKILETYASCMDEDNFL